MSELNMRKPVHPLTLSFSDKVVEQDFERQDFPHRLAQGRLATLVGLSVYGLYGVLDIWFVPADARIAVWATRLAAMGVAGAILLASYHPLFARAHNALLAAVGLSAGIGLLGIFWQLPMESTLSYYPGLVLATFFTYNFVGTRFTHALAVDLIVLVSYNVLFGLIREFPVQVLANHDFFILSANLIGGSAAYLAERQRRRLFLRERALDAEREHQHERALHDRLTRLPNRELLEDRLQQAISFALRENRNCAALFIDLDGFKPINDSLGHEVGDEVLKQTAKRLSAALRDTDTVARLGGDEFFVIAQNVESAEKASELARMLQLWVEEPLQFPLMPSPLTVSASIGICMFPWPDCTCQDVIRRADEAMYHSKRRGRNGFFIGG